MCPTSDADQSTNDLDAIYRAIGFVVIQWGLAEQSLEMLVVLLFNSFGGKKLAKRIPVLLSHKLNFVRQCLASAPRLAKYRVDGEALAGQFESLSATRNDLVHGAICSLAPVGGKLMFAKLDFRNNLPVHRQVNLDMPAFPKLAEDLIALGHNAAGLAMRLLDEFKNTDKISQDQG